MGVVGSTVRVGTKVVGIGSKFLGKGGIAGFLASIAIAEVIARALEDAVGDPEAAVTAILKAGGEQAISTANFAQTQSADVQEAVAKSFQGIHPEKRLTELALMKRGALSITPDDTPVLAYISSKLGMNPQRLMELSNPSRMGDFAELQTVLPPEAKGK